MSRAEAGGTVLITLGRLPKALDLARSFHGHGWRVLVADPHRRHLCAVSRSVAASVQVPPPRAGKAAYLDALAALVAAHGVDLVLPVSEETLHVAHLAGRLADSVRLYAPPPDRLVELHDKGRFIALAAGLGLAVPETHALGTPGATALAAARDHVVKPRFGCAGVGVALRPRGAALPPGGGAIVQARLMGPHRSSFSIAHRGRVQATAVYRGTVMAGTTAAAFARAPDPGVEAWVARFVAATGFSGFLSFDFIVTDTGPQAIECNPRVTSGIHFLATADLAPAILTPFAAPIRPGRWARMQQFWPTLTETQGAILRPRVFARHLGALVTSRDVTWDPRDPWPLLTMPVTAAAILSRSIRRGVSFGQAATDDIAWFEGD